MSRPGRGSSCSPVGGCGCDDCGGAATELQQAVQWGLFAASARPADTPFWQGATVADTMMRSLPGLRVFSSPFEPSAHEFYDADAATPSVPAMVMSGFSQPMSLPGLSDVNREVASRASAQGDHDEDEYSNSESIQDSWHRHTVSNEFESPAEDETEAGAGGQKLPPEWPAVDAGDPPVTNDMIATAGWRAVVIDHFGCKEKCHAVVRVNGISGTAPTAVGAIAAMKANAIKVGKKLSEFKDQLSCTDYNDDRALWIFISCKCVHKKYAAYIVSNSSGLVGVSEDDLTDEQLAAWDYEYRWEDGGGYAGTPLPKATADLQVAADGDCEETRYSSSHFG